MSERSRSQQKEYNVVKNSENFKENCVFCKITHTEPQFILETKSFMVIHNTFPYSVWDMQPVNDHLMIVPKRHTDTVSSFTPDEAIEFMDLIGSYETQGYNFWGRAPKSIIKSVFHQHTHLIKPGPTKKKFVLYLRKPHIRISR